MSNGLLLIHVHNYRQKQTRFACANTKRDVYQHMAGSAHKYDEFYMNDSKKRTTMPYNMKTGFW